MRVLERMPLSGSSQEQQESHLFCTSFSSRDLLRLKKLRKEKKQRNLYNEMVVLYPINAFNVMLVTQFCGLFVCVCDLYEYIVLSAWFK